MFRNLLLLLSVLVLANCTKQSCEYDGEIKTDEEKVAYSIGYQMGQSAQFEGVNLNVDLIRQGVVDAYSAGEPKLSPEDRKQARITLNKLIQQARVKDAPKNKEVADQFMAENAQKDGVKTHESGVQYTIEKEGEGKKPTEDGKVTVHYRGTLINGSEFDSSYARNKPASLPLKSVIPGWQKILPEMKEGAKWKIFIPPHLAYGEMARPGIPSNSVLMFDIELLKVE